MRWKRRESSRTQAATSQWAWLYQLQPDAAAVMDSLATYSRGGLDYARLHWAFQQVAEDFEATMQVAEAIARDGPAALRHTSGLRGVPGLRFAAHDLVGGQVRLGRVAPRRNTVLTPFVDFGLDLDALRTSLLVVGPPGSGKTRSVAVPIIEHLMLESLANRASVLVVDPKGDDFDYPGWFDITIDPSNPTWGLSLFGGAPDADMAADRLAAALLPVNVSDDKAYFVDASKNALYKCLAPFHEAHGRWPTVRELLAVLRADQSAIDQVKSRLKGPDAKYYKQLLDERKRQAGGRLDAAASLVERLSLLDRPALRRILDADRKFEMNHLNRPIRVRVAIRESEFPDASRTLARLVISQFVQTAGSSTTNRAIFKGLVIDEAGRYVDDYVVRGVQILRSNNAGMVLLTQSLAHFPTDLQTAVFGSTGCKFVFGGIDTEDADKFSRWFGDHYVTEYSFSRNVSSSTTFSYGTFGPLPSGRSEGNGRGSTEHRIERARWTPSDIITGIPPGHVLTGISRSDGERIAPILVNLRA